MSPFLGPFPSQEVDWYLTLRAASKFRALHGFPPGISNPTADRDSLVALQRQMYADNKIRRAPREDLCDEM